MNALAGLPNITSLNLSACNNLRNIDAVHKLTKLQVLNIRESQGELTELSLTGLPDLHTVLTDASLFEKVSFVDLPRLESIDLSGDFDLAELELRKLPVLKTIDLSGCNRLRTVDFSDAEALETIRMVMGWYGDEPVELESVNVARLEDLGALEIINCKSLSTIQGLQYLQSLTALDLRGCEGLTQLDGLKELSLLLVLDLTGCSHLEQIDDASELRDLVGISIAGCSRIRSLKALHGLSDLQVVFAKGLQAKEVDLLRKARKEISINVLRTPDQEISRTLAGLVRQHPDSR